MQQSGTKRLQDFAWLGGKIIYWELYKRLKFDIAIGVCIIQNPNKRMKRVKFSGI